MKGAVHSAYLDRTLGGRYQIQEFLGEGRMGQVFLAYDRQSRERKAVKLIDVGARRLPMETLLRFRAEAETLARLHHPAIIRYEDFVQEGSLSAIVMEYVSAPTLREAIAERGPLPLNDVFFTLRSLAGALHYMHEQGLVHHDLKSANILTLMDANGVQGVRILDFGLSHLVGANESDFSGTLGYMAPEQTGMLHKLIDHRADLYALGCILYEAITGRLPFISEDPALLMHQHVARAPEPPTRLRSDCPPALERITLKLLNKDPDDRYRTAAGLIRDVERLDRLRASAPLTAVNFAPGEEDHWESFPRQNPFLNRREELHEIETRLKAAGEAGGAILLIEGPQGNGKSALLEEGFNRAQREKGETWFLRARREETEIHFKTIVGILGKMVAHLKLLDEEKQQKLLGVIRESLGERFGFLLQLLPELAAWYEPDAASRAQAWTADDYRFAALSFMQSVARKMGRLALFLDDLHNVDLASARILLEATDGELADAPVIFFFSYNREQLSPGLRRIIDELQSKRVQRLHVEPLSQPIVAELLHRLFSGKLIEQSALIGPLYSAAGGNPARLRSILQSLIDQQIILYEAAGWKTDLERALAFIDERRKNDGARLPDVFTAREIATLRLSAVFQRAFLLEALYAVLNPEYVEQMGGPGEADALHGKVDLLTTLDRAIHASVLSVDSRRLYAFRDPALRSALKEELPVETRRAAHRTVARFIEKQVLPESPEAIYDIAFHYELAGEARLAAEACIAAAKLTDDGTNANRQAQSYYRAAVRLLDSAPGVFTLSEEFDARHRALAFDVALDPQREGLEDEIDRLAALAGEDNVVGRILALQQKAQLCFYFGRRDEMLAISEQILELGEGPEYEQYVVPSLLQLGLTPSHRSYAERAEILARGAAMALRVRRFDLAPPAMTVHAAMLAYQGRFADARKSIDDFAAHVPASQRVFLDALAAFSHGIVNAEAGDFARQAEALASIDIERAPLGVVGRRILMAHAARAYGLSGRLREALHYYEKLFTNETDTRQRGELAVALHGRALLALRMEDPESAIEFVERGLRHLGNRPDAFMEAMFHLTGTVAELDVGQIARATEYFTAARELSAKLHSKLLDAHVTFIGARLSFARTRQDADLEQAEAALAQFLEMGATGYYESYREDFRQWRQLGGDSSSHTLLAQGENRELFQLLEINRKLSSTLDADELTGEVLRGAMTITGAQEGYLFIAEPDPAAPGQPRAVLKLSRNAAGETIPDSERAYSETIVDATVFGRSPILTRDARNEARWNAADSVRLKQMRSILSTPIQLQDQLLGVIYLDNHSASSVFTLKDREIAENFAIQAAIAMNNARLFEAEQASRTRVESTLRTFARFVPRQFTERFAEGAIDLLERGISRRERITVLFSDLRDFTALSESLSPEETFGLLNEYLERMEAAIRAEGGFVDKFVGDAIMALFDAAPASAIRAAVAMFRALDAMNGERAAAGLPLLDAGIGVNSGEVTIGVIGSAERLDTTVVGDAVNTASRVESLTKDYGARLLVTGVVFDECSRDLRFRELDTVRVKGRSAPTSIYECLDVDPPELAERKLALLPEFEAARAEWTAGRFDEAAVRFSDYLKEFPEDRAAQNFLERAKRFALLPPADWDGVFRLETK